MLDNPDIGKYFNSESIPVDEGTTSSELDALQIPDVPENAAIYDCWEKAAKRLINALLKNNSNWIFFEPVDPVKLGIPDYFDIIKHPMDFGTVKNNLQNNKYLKAQEFLADI